MDIERSEYLLMLLARAASLCERDRPQALVLLQEALAHLWRLLPGKPMLSALQLEEKLSLPIEQWLPESVRSGYTGALVSSALPTQTCKEMLLELDVRQFWERIQEVVKEVRDLCRLRNDGDILYRKFRRFLIEDPVIDPMQSAPVLIPLGRELSEFYELIPEHLKSQGRIYRCPECRWPMNPTRGEVECDSAWCRDKNSLYQWKGRNLVNRMTNQELQGELAGSRHMLKAALWKFTLLPGLLELQLAQQLSELGLDVTLWPDVDRSDLRLNMGGMALDIDAKAWISPQALAQHLEQLPATAMRWIVIPDYQSAHVNFLQERSPAGMSVFTQSGCIRELKKRAHPF